MGYYLDRAPGNKTQFEELDFTPQQLNLVSSMMMQCGKLRQRDIIINLFRCSLPDKFNLELVKKTNEDETRSWNDPQVHPKNAEELKALEEYKAEQKAEAKKLEVIA